MLPEMALTGYQYLSPASIMPYLEQPRIGLTSLFARSMAKRLSCHVIAGYPEALPPSSTSGGHDGKQGSEGVSSGVGWNSAMVVDAQGEVVGNYRKTFRFDTDKHWAREGVFMMRGGGKDFAADDLGDGFRYFDLPEPLGRVALGICMGTHKAPCCRTKSSLKRQI